MSRIKLFALLFLVTVAVCDTTSRTARISWTNPNVTRYLPTDIDYLLPKADGSGFDALSTSMDTNSYPWKFITFNFYRMVVEDLLTHPAADIIDIPVDQTFTFVTTLDTPTGAPVPNPTYEDNKPHIFVRNATDSFWSLNYHGSTLGSASLGRSTEEPMPMFCDGSSVFIYTGNEILKFGMDLTLQGNVTVDSTDVSFQQIMNYDKNGISKILIGANDADEAVIVSINTDFSAVVATNVVSIIDNVQMTDFAAPISASKNVAPDSIHYGFIDFDTTENNWVFTVDGWANQTGTYMSMARIGKDVRNDRLVLNTMWMSNDFSSMGQKWQTLNLDQTPIEGESGTVEYDLSDPAYSCMMEDPGCFDLTMRVYADVLMKTHESKPTEDGVQDFVNEFIFTMANDPHDSGMWVKAGLLAVLLALALLA